MYLQLCFNNNEQMKKRHYIPGLSLSLIPPPLGRRTVVSLVMNECIFSSKPTATFQTGELFQSQVHCFYVPF